jgi:hypothetical protein
MAVGFRISPDCVAEREEFELSVRFVPICCADQNPIRWNLCPVSAQSNRPRN